ncbi:hypothetical protein PSN45_000912 [Yamadazyma tenuis]|uniref:General substrate transporter n=1 Tax=Candida tenuis (strain ATCC 10573 / BCRC 21748 / CBS 615 / JCM 9827 / NBRC 10315 / NRRL Y-1498 / VKM Y-70) TaxID=590646 RepID=G3BBH6_CANTC|nr:general substrate transporter [Yamadazyma tenuis ATCC 10573]XP_006688985.1 uncharacterized protein CANTEDRAFT_115657 [Yamadazyma tenuis ATCC 10573]EGV62814.1 general substrate transporter [Yamadazyma tenuis ATCC 10573]EGV62815.1 hypothetical protein CANTEDRAFT_115657 [Yamadazyma tenuis ATCC 10573]WEJ93449.1 hypothetical protein PSN45_000912 [Yamadazyma tenuis]
MSSTSQTDSVPAGQHIFQSDEKLTTPSPVQYSDSNGSDDDQIYSYIGMQGKKLHLAVAIMCGVGFILFGYDQGVMGSLLTLGHFRETFPEIDTVTYGYSRSAFQGFAIGIYEIGCFASALSTIWLGDKYGRIKLVFAGCFIMMIGGALQACAFHISHLIVARVVTGLGNGFITSTVPVWQSEIAKPEQRGKLICIHGALIAGGIAISYWVDFAFYFTRNLHPHQAVSWRFPIAFQCIFPLVIMPFIFKFPESPRWLLRQGRVHEARKVFSALEGVPANSAIVNDEINEIEESIRMEKSTGADKFSFRRLFKQGPKRHFHRLCLAGWAQLIQQICGINLITYYAGTIFEQYIGLNALDSRILAACNGLEYFLAGLIPILFIEKWGRRPLLIAGSIGQCVCMVVLTVASYYSDDKWGGRRNGAPIVAAVFLFGFNTFFALAFLSEMWLLPPELTSLETRAPSAAISTCCNWLSNFVVVMITPVLFQSIGPFTYALFAGINFLIVPVLYIFYPETKGRSLEEMDLIFNKTPINKPWQVVRIAATMPYHHAGLHEEETELVSRVSSKTHVSHIEV